MAIQASVMCPRCSLALRLTRGRPRSIAAVGCSRVSARDPLMVDALPNPSTAPAAVFRLGSNQRGSGASASSPRGVALVSHHRLSSLARCQGTARQGRFHGLLRRRVSAARLRSRMPPLVSFESVRPQIAPRSSFRLSAEVARRAKVRFRRLSSQRYCGEG